MALATDVTIEVVNSYSNDGYRYIFRGVGQWAFKKSQPAMSIPIVDATPQNNVLFRFSGQVEEVSFQFVIIDDGTDTAAGTSGGTKVTVDQQIAYLKDSIYSEEFDTYWTLTQTSFFPSGINGVITDISIDAEGGNPTMRKASITFMRGRVGSL